LLILTNLSSYGPPHKFRRSSSVNCELGTDCVCFLCAITSFVAELTDCCPLAIVLMKGHSLMEKGSVILKVFRRPACHSIMTETLKRATIAPGVIPLESFLEGAQANCAYPLLNQGKPPRSAVAGRLGHDPA